MCSDVRNSPRSRTVHAASASAASGGRIETGAAANSGADSGRCLRR